MLLVLKIDEVCEVVYYVDFDFVCIIEIWFKDYIDNNIVVIFGYNVICWDWIEVVYGGVCLYIKEFI